MRLKTQLTVSVDLEMVFAWNTCFTVWLVILTGVNCGVSDNCAHGSMKATATAWEVLHGSDVTLSCWLKNSNLCGSSPEIIILHNNSKLYKGYGHSTSARTLLSSFGEQKFECRCLARTGRQPIICGIYLYVGLPPAQPINTVCLQYGKDGNTHCIWEKGKYTYLSTIYTLQLQTNGITIRTFMERGNNVTYGSVDLDVPLDWESTYTAVILARNDLGNTSSRPIHFTLNDIVKPHSPVNISMKCDDFDATNCTILWQDDQETGYFRLRYQPNGSNAWTMIENITSRIYILWGLKQDTEYEFQVSSRFLPNRGLWSDWSVPYQIEAVPLGPVDVWYLKNNISPYLQIIILFWKTASLSATRRSHYYRVTYQSLPQQLQRSVETISTTDNIFSKVTPIRGYKILLNSYNTRGSSPLTNFTTELGISEDLPPPNNISATTVGNDTIFVAWEAPLTHSWILSGYVVEWTKLHEDSHLKRHSDWFKIPEAKRTAKIDNLEPNVCYLIRVFALYKNRAGKAASVTEDISTKAPLIGPQINVTVMERSILVYWKEMPEDPQGCIISYKMYLQEQFHSAVPKVYNIPKDTTQPFSVKYIQPGSAYAVWMTASTKAGESLKGNEEVIYTKNTHDLASILAICIILGLIVGVCLVPSARQMAFSILPVFLTGWYSKAIPDPVNSSWAKEFTSVKDESSFNSTPFLNHLHSFEEPEILQIEEVFIRKFPVYKDVLFFQDTEKRETHNWPTGISSQKEDFTVKDSNYNPLFSSTLHNTKIGIQQLPSLYRKVAPEETTQDQMFSEYIANPLEDETDYLPPMSSPTVMNTNEESCGVEFSLFSGFSRTSFAPQLSFGGKLTLDAVRMDCNSQIIEDTYWPKDVH